MRITGTGSYLPFDVVENDVFSDDRFHLRSGSVRRRWATDEDDSIGMATSAAREALTAAELDPADVDYVIGYCGMPDYLYPKDTNQIAAELGATRAAAWTLDTACASSISGLLCAEALISAGRADNVVVTSAMHWVGRGIDRDNTDYSSLGDGAGAFVVQRADQSSRIASLERTDPSGFDFVMLKSPFATKQQEVIEFSTDPRYREYFGRTVLEPVREMLAEAGNPTIDWFVPHQVGSTLIGIWCKSLGLEPDQLLDTFSETGNMSAANVPHIIDHHVRTGTIERGQNILMFAPGAGIHIAATLWKF